MGVVESTYEWMSGDQGWMDGMNERVRVQVGVAGRGGSLSPFGSFVFVSL